tara:strand:- start:2053 stop:2778 length:726 start_codon:yes stop_codon:yes gene_type:complete
MIVYPAIDLIGGSCVRLYRGDFDQQTTYHASPVEVAQTYRAEGAEWLHLVDLDGAKNPENRQIPLIKNIIQASDLKVQTGGGVRSVEDVEKLLHVGASRVVIGSLAVKDQDTTQTIFKKFGAECICLATDVLPQNGEYMIAVSGWQEGSAVTINDLIEGYLDVGLKHILCTDISRDGTLGGPNIDLYKTVKNDFADIQIQASGGVSSLDDLKVLNTDGIIIGKALYEDLFTVEQALEAAAC